MSCRVRVPSLQSAAPVLTVRGANRKRCGRCDARRGTTRWRGRRWSGKSGGEEIKVAQPRINRKKKMKGRIYQKLKKGQIEEGEVGDGVEDMAEDKVSARR